MSNELQTQKQEVQVSDGVERTRSARVFAPQVDIYSVEDGIVLLADMPGVGEKDVDITLEKNVLTISGLISNKEPEGYDLVHNEYGIGDYQRSFTVSDEIDQDKIEASLNNGVLRLHLPKSTKARAKKITVKVD